MGDRANYLGARDRAGFGWYVGIDPCTPAMLAGVSRRDFYLEPSACIEAFKKGRPAAREMFGDVVSLPGPGTPTIRYGHVNTLGCALNFPEGGEVCFEPAFSTLKEGIEKLKSPVDLASAGMMPFYLEFQRRMQDAFPGEMVAFNFGATGPITTAWALRRDDLFLDIYDDPEATKEFLRLSTESLAQYKRFLSRMTGAPEISPAAGAIGDDMSSALPPWHWPEFVAPYWEQYFQGITTGVRSAHAEALAPEHLKFLEDARIMNYDPSVSPRLNPRIIRDTCGIPFNWSLFGWAIPYMTARDIEDFVYQAASDGVTNVVMVVENGLCNDQGVRAVHAFVDASRRVKSLLESGHIRDEIGEMVSEAGRERFWAHWPK